MSSTIHGLSHQAIKFFRDNPAALAIYWIYCSRVNPDNVAWPSLAGLARDTGWSKQTCHDARQWLIDCEALKVVEDYIRPEWRNLSAKKRAQKVNLDRSVYLRPWGTICVENRYYPLLYNPQGEKSDIETYEESTDGLADRPSKASDVKPGRPELDSKVLKDSTNKDIAPQNGAAQSHAQTGGSQEPANGAGGELPVSSSGYEKPAKPGNLSDKQWEAIRPVYQLGAAIHTMPADNEVGTYRKVINHLDKAGVGACDFAEYVGYIIAYERGVVLGLQPDDHQWTITVTSLMQSGRVSRYLAQKRGWGVSRKSILDGVTVI